MVSNFSPLIQLPGQNFNFTLWIKLLVQIGKKAGNPYLCADDPPLHNLFKDFELPSEATGNFDFDRFSLLVRRLRECLVNTIVASKIVYLCKVFSIPSLTSDRRLTGIGSPSTEPRARDHAAIMTRSEVAFAIL